MAPHIYQPRLVLLFWYWRPELTVFTYDLQTERAANIGLIVLQTDERIEQDFRRLIPETVNFYASRVQSDPDVSSETLQQMENHVPQSASLFPGSIGFDVVGYGCTSGTAQIGQNRIAELVRQGTATRHVTEPVSALLAACASLGISRLAFLSPYVETVSDRLRGTLSDNGVDTPVFGTFAEAEEAKVARITPASIMESALQLADCGGVDGVFLSCTNLNTLDSIAPLENATGLPVLSSNFVLAWHMCALTGAPLAGLDRTHLSLAGHDLTAQTVA